MYTVSPTLTFELLQNKTNAVQEVPIQTPGENEILVRVKAIAINPTDWKRSSFSTNMCRNPPNPPPLCTQMPSGLRSLGLTSAATLLGRSSKLGQTSKLTSKSVIRSLRLFVEGFPGSGEHSPSTPRRSRISRSSSLREPGRLKKLPLSAFRSSLISVHPFEGR